MQGLHDFIPTDVKISYIQELLGTGFDTLDFGSFVSHKTIPQMKDTAQVLDKLDLTGTSTRLLAIVANRRGAEEASAFEKISYLGFPFSISETFQQRNTNSTIDESLSRVEEIQNICINTGKEMVVYISMAFGNPYGDTWGPEIGLTWSHRLSNELGVKIISLADTTGVSNPENISLMFGELLPELSGVEVGAHLHSIPGQVSGKLAAAFDAGCRRFDGALRGFGGCPMASDTLTGNMPTEVIKGWFEGHKIPTGLNEEKFQSVLLKSSTVFPPSI